MPTLRSAARHLLLPVAALALAAPAYAAAPRTPFLWQEMRRPAPAPAITGPHSMAVALPGEAPQDPRFFVITPERRALLNTIRYAEGTWARGEDRGYWIMFGGSLMPSLDRHPNRVNRTPGYASAAAGAYQFMPFTWTMASSRMGLNGFGPHVQDQAAIFLIQRRGALEKADRGVFTPQLAARLAPEWASFPTLAGHSFYGQPVKRFDELRRFYDANLAELRASLTLRTVVAVAPTPPPVCDNETLSCALEQVTPTP